MHAHTPHPTRTTYDCTPPTTLERHETYDRRHTNAQLCAHHRHHSLTLRTTLVYLGELTAADGRCEDGRGGVGFLN